MRNFGLGLLAALALLSVGSSAHADLTGDSVDVQYLYPTISSVVQDLGDTSVPGSTSYANVQISITGDLVTISTANPGQDFQAATFNGFSIADITKNPDITGIEFLQNSSTVPGNFTTSDITFNSDEVFFNFEGQNWCNCDGVTYSAEFLLFFGTNNVPEPPTVALLGAALGGLGLFFARRRRHRGTPNALAA